MTLYLCSGLSESDLLLIKFSGLEAISVSLKALGLYNGPKNLNHQSSLKSLTFLGMSHDAKNLQIVSRALKTLSKGNTIQHLSVCHSKVERPNGHDYSDFVMDVMPYLPNLVSLNISPLVGSGLTRKRHTTRYMRKHHSLIMPFLYRVAQRRHEVDGFVPYLELSWEKFERNYEGNIDAQHHLCGSILEGLALSNLPKCFKVLYATGFYSEFCDRDIILLNTVEFSIEF